jgi:hypothetical protein
MLINATLNLLGRTTGNIPEPSQVLIDHELDFPHSQIPRIRSGD